MPALLDRIRSKDAKVGVVGLGYVGLPLSLAFARSGFEVLGFDIDPAKIQKIAAGESYIRHIDAPAIREATSRGRFAATTDFSRARGEDCLIICVPTPLTAAREPDLSFITGTGESLAPHLRAGQLVVLESTTYPGTTEECLKPILEKSGLRAGADFHLAFSPEREDPGNAKFHTAQIPKVVGGMTPACLEAAMALYGAAIDRIVPVSSTRAAEMTKLLENIYRSVNIAMVNELKMLCHRMGIDVFEVIDAAATKPFGFQAFYPGPGLGGHCIPIDPFYLTWKAREYEFSTRFIELAGEINIGMPLYVVQRTMEALNELGKALKGSRILVMGIAYKRDVDDMRESPAIRVIELLQERGAEVAYHDPYVPAVPRMRAHKVDLRSVPFTPAELARYDAAVIVTDHGSIDYQALVDAVPLVVDSRRATAKVTRHRERIHVA
ncbi:MAG TPA: nucleotide sugar dehydrogenase [Myxococcales bacterium]|nr:nucleotide sugar dehydrogenase [Myxococcales bacterium]